MGILVSTLPNYATGPEQIMELLTQDVDSRSELHIQERVETRGRA